MSSDVPTIRATADEIVTRAEGIQRGALRVVSGVTGLSDDDLVGVTVFCSIGAGASWWLYRVILSSVLTSSYYEAFRGSFIGFGMLAGTALAVLVYRYVRSAGYRRRLRAELKWMDDRIIGLEERASPAAHEEIELLSAQRRRIVQAIADDTLTGLSVGARGTQQEGRAAKSPLTPDLK